jgi:hypothetical protein
MKIFQALVLIKICSFSAVIFSQSNSVSENWCATEGNLTTNSTIHNGQRVYHGPYSFVGIRDPHEGMPKGTMSVKGTKKLGLMHGTFLMERKGAHFKGDRNFSMSGELFENVMIGTWKFKSKQYNSLAYNNDKFTYDKNYTLEFNKVGQIIKGTRVDNDNSTQNFFQTDENGYLHGKIVDKYKEYGYLIEEEEIWFHGIKISSWKKDVKTKVIMGQTNYFVDTNLINANNFVPIENGFTNPKFDFFNLTCQKLKDSLDIQNKLLISMKESEEFKRYNYLIDEKLNIENTLQKLQSNIDFSANDLKKYSVKKYSEKLYLLLKTTSILMVDSKIKKDIEKLIIKLKKSGQIDEKSQNYFVLQGDSISLLKIVDDASFEEIKFDKKIAKSIQKMFNEKMLYVDSNQANVKLNLSGIDSNYFIIRSKLELLNKDLEKNKEQLKQLESEKIKFIELPKLYQQIDMKFKYFENELNKNKILLEKEKRILKVKLDREAYKYIFNDVNEMGDLLDCLEIKFIYKLPLIGKLDI